MRKIIILLVMVLFGMPVWAAGSGVTVSEAWARATAPGQDSGSVRFSIVSGKAAKLVAISSPVAGTVELHVMAHEDGEMKMRAVGFIDLPSGKSVDLGKHGYHVMLLNLKQPLKAGETVPLTLTVEFADKGKATIEVKAEVVAQGASHTMHDMTDMEGMHHHGY